MLASAQLGVCLHTSSSGLDLAMKVVDMFGGRLPVASVSFPALPELVKDGVNGRVFLNSQELGDIIQDWFQGFPLAKRPDQQAIRDNIDQFRKLGWSENCDKVAMPVFKQKSADSYSSSIVILAFFACLFCFFSSLTSVPESRVLRGSKSEV